MLRVAFSCEISQIEVLLGDRQYKGVLAGHLIGIL